MKSRRFEIMAFCAMVFAIAALFVALQSNSRADDGPGDTVPAVGEEPQALQAPQAAQAIPTTFNYQGILRNPDGSLMNGSHDVMIRMYDIASGGGPFHQETFSAVPVRDGLFNVVLGDSVALPSGNLQTAPLFVGVSVDGGGELIPRQRIHPVPWALLATNATNAVTANTLVNSATVNGLNLNGLMRIGDKGAYIDDNGGTDGVRVKGAFLGYVTPENQFGLYANSSGTTIYGNANVTGQIRVNGTRPIFLRKYTNYLANNGTTDVGFRQVDLDTGVSASDYTCTVAGHFMNIDVNENGYSNWSRYAYVNGSGNWHVIIDTKTHGERTNPPANFDLLCISNQLAWYEYVNGDGQVSNVAPEGFIENLIQSSEGPGQSDVAPGDAQPDPTSSSEEAGQ